MVSDEANKLQEWKIFESQLDGHSFACMTLGSQAACDAQSAYKVSKSMQMAARAEVMPTCTHLNIMHRR